MQWLHELQSHLLGHLVWYLLGLCGALVLAYHRYTVSILRTAVRISRAGVTRMIFSRSHYPERLARYLEHAKHSIRIVSITLKQTNDEGRLIDLFRRKLAGSSSFEISISLMHPGSAAAELAAKSLDMPIAALNEEIQHMLDALADFRSHLNRSEQERLQICTHACLPMGSAIMLDASASSGRIQVETKLYRTPRVSSFGYEIVRPSEFFAHNFEAWNRVIRDSIPVA